MNYVKKILAMEPIAVQGVLRAVFVLIAAAGLTIPENFEVRTLAVVAAFYALVELVTTLWARTRVTPTAAVVERVKDDLVVAGPANEIPTGRVIRSAGEPDSLYDY